MNTSNKFFLAALLILTTIGFRPAFAQSDSMDSMPRPATSEETERLVEDIGNFFGKGAQVVGGVVREIFKDLGLPNATIKGTEGAGAFIFGYKKGKGTLSFGGQSSRVYWTGASLGFDVGGDLSKVYMLVYKLKKRTDLYRTMGGAEGKVYFVVGAGAQLGGVKYESEEDGLVVVPLRMGVGWRQGVNVGTLKMSATETIWPF